jgi:hypothetical protein
LNALNRELDISFGISDADAANSPDERRSPLACNRRVSRDTLVEYPCDIHYAHFQPRDIARQLKRKSWLARSRDTRIFRRS